VKEEYTFFSSVSVWPKPFVADNSREKCEASDESRAKVFTVESGTVATYMHNAVKPGLGKIGVLVALEGEGEAQVVEALGRQIGMHVAATNPQALDISAVEPSALERERAVLTEQAQASGKPPAVIEKMVEGRIRKFYEEVVLLEQVWVHDGESRVKAVVEKAGLKMSDIQYFELNEAFAVVGIANTKLMGLDPAKVNVNGGAVSLGQPLGCSGARIIVTLINVLKQNGAKYGAAGICNGGGGASAMVIEAL
jgi:acetyl-CoA acetyltransferase